MNKYKLIACDLDGTLFNKAFEVSDENRIAIKALNEQGVLFVPTTGRTLFEMKEVADIHDIKYVIYSNGAAIFDKEKNEHIRMCMSEKEANFVINTVDQADSFVVMHRGGKAYSHVLDAYTEKYYNVTPVADIIYNRSIMQDNLYKIDDCFDDVEMFSVFFHDEKEKEECKNILKMNPGLHVVEGWDFNLEIFSVNSGKDKALKKLAELLDIDMKDTISIGDSGNDIEMTKASGLGLVVSNACEQLKMTADRVICSNEEHVVKYVLNEYFGE